MCTQLYSSRSFVSVLEYLLAIGNYLNENAGKRKAKGFRLSSLTKVGAPLLCCHLTFGGVSSTRLIKLLIDIHRRISLLLLSPFNFSSYPSSAWSAESNSGWVITPSVSNSDTQVIVSPPGFTNQMELLAMAQTLGWWTLDKSNVRYPTIHSGQWQSQLL